MIESDTTRSSGGASGKRRFATRRPRQIFWRFIPPAALYLATTIVSPQPLVLAQSPGPAQPSTSAPAPSGNAARNPPADPSHTAAAIDAGRSVFNQRCSICHFVDSTAAKIGPGLKGLFARARFADGKKVTEASVAKVIADGGKDMPAYDGLLKPGELKALIAYLKIH
jgi:cytochrome c2